MAAPFDPVAEIVPFRIVTESTADVDDWAPPEDSAYPDPIPAPLDPTAVIFPF
jgi:hypothetical protein